MTELDQHLLLYRSTGNPDALGALFDAAAPALLRIARRMTADASSADDALQETFLTVAEKAQDWDPSRPAGPWLVGVLSHRALDVRRKAVRRVEPDRITERSVAEPWESLQAEDLDLVVRKAVEGLPPGERAVVTASLFDGLSGVQLAERFGLRGGTARVRLHRGLERLRGALPMRAALGLVGFSTSSARLAAVKSRILASTGGASVAASSKGGFAMLFLAMAIGAVLVWRGVLPLLRSDAGTSTETVSIAALDQPASEVVAVTAGEERVAIAAPLEDEPLENPAEVVRVHVVHASNGKPANGFMVEAGWRRGGEWWTVTGALFPKRRSRDGAVRRAPGLRIESL